jgi:hypothetical protein
LFTTLRALVEFVKNPSLSPQEVTSLPQGERLALFAVRSEVLEKIKYYHDLALISPLAGEMSPSLPTERGSFGLAFSSTIKNPFILRSRNSGVSKDDGIYDGWVPSPFETRATPAPQDEGIENLVRELHA